MNQTSALQCRLYTPFIRFSNIVHSTAAFFFLALFCAGLLRAAPVDDAKAQVFAQRWLAAVDQPLGADFSAQSEIVSIVPITNSSGATIAYNVTLSPSGYVIISADDRLQPVITFSGNGSYDDTPANPLRALLQIDLQSRLAAVAQLAPEGPAVRGVDPVEPPPAVLENKSAWERFTGPATRADAAEVVAEVWVGSFVKSQWSQGGGIYNYYTPTIYDHSYTFQEPGNPDNIVCGCTATAMAQVMRYFQWPQKGVGVKQGSANITLRDTIVNPDPISITMNLRGGNGAGGPYNWDLMSLSPTGDEDLETLQQIGALCLDVGLSVGMNYNRENKSESAGSPSPGSYTNFFKYSGAGNPGGADGARANLDARRPVLVVATMVVDPTTSHALFADGYGRIDGRWYYHLNLGWGGSANGWYNLEENVLFGGTPYQNQDGIAFGIGNIYRQRLQDNEKIDNAGRIISGRITDANGLPVAGVKVSIRKASQTPGEVWQRMLVWNEPIDPVATPVYKDWEGAAPGAGLYRHWTDANGIWAIDKVENGDYVIQLEKAGLEFLGTTDINVNKNRWGLNFVASPAGGLLSLQNWWYDGALLYLEFDRAIGNVLVNLGKIKVDNKNLLDSTVYQSDASNIMVIDTSTRFMPITIEDTSVVTIESGFLSIDVDGNNAYDGQDGINDLPSINAVEEKTNIAVGAAPADSAVTAITRVGASPQAGSEIKFTVSGTGLENITLQDFHLRVSSSGRRAVSVPSVSISAWDANSGEITLQVGAGEGLIRVDYIPGSGGTPFLQGEICHVDNAGPAIIKAELYGDNTYVTLTWNEPAGKNDNTALTPDSLRVLLHANGGIVENVSIDRITDGAGNPTGGALQEMRVYLKYNPGLDDAVGVPAGVETIEIKPYANAVYDAFGNVASEGNTSDELLLYKSNRPRLKK
ncbi:MAG: hypothetical protein GX927_04075, partial [Lentisphaerae bacterium]|nr:hypothetical protein [Lentisphaerota bacterium]